MHASWQPSRPTQCGQPYLENGVSHSADDVAHMTCASLHLDIAVLQVGLACLGAVAGNIPASIVGLCTTASTESAKFDYSMPPKILGFCLTLCNPGAQPRNQQYNCRCIQSVLHLKTSLCLHLHNLPGHWGQNPSMHACRSIKHS